MRSIDRQLPHRFELACHRKYDRRKSRFPADCPRPFLATPFPCNEPTVFSRRRAHSLYALRALARTAAFSRQHPVRWLWSLTGRRPRHSVLSALSSFRYSYALSMHHVWRCAVKIFFPGRTFRYSPFRLPSFRLITPARAPTLQLVPRPKMKSRRATANISHRHRGRIATVNSRRTRPSCSDPHLVETFHPAVPFWSSGCINWRTAGLASASARTI